MTDLTFYGGVGEIGGNKTLLEENNTRIFLDFGKSYGGEKDYYEEPFLKPRKEQHLLKLGLLPDLEGLYNQEPKFDGVIISHPHLDHWGYTGFLNNEIPLYMGEDSKKIILSHEYRSGAGPRKEYYLANLTKGDGAVEFANMNTFESENDFSIGSFNITPLEVDHSVPGSYGFIIDSNTKTIVYTGDFRLHGPKKDKTQRFVEKASEANPDILVTEGTNLTNANLSTEEEVENKLSKIISKVKGLTVVSSSGKDLHRLKTIYKAAKANNRKLAITGKQAFLLKNYNEINSELNLNNENIIVVSKERSSTYAWEEELEKQKRVNGIEEIDEIQDNVVLVATYYFMNELMKIKPEPGSVFVLSSSEPFDEAGELHHEKLLEWCEHYGIPQYHVHSSGHIAPHQLKSVIDEINPGKVIPIHTENSEILKRYISDLGIKTEIPKKGKTIKI